MQERPDAVIAGSDEVAAGMVIEGLANGIRIPEDIAILGVDDQPLASCIQIPLTTIRQPIAQEGEYAAKEMIRQLRDGAEDTIRKELDLELRNPVLVFKRNKLVTIPKSGNQGGKENGSISKS